MHTEGQQRWLKSSYKEATEIPFIFTSENLSLATRHESNYCKNPILISSKCFKLCTLLLSNTVQPRLERPILADFAVDHPQGKLSFMYNVPILSLKRVCAFEQSK